MKTTTQQLKQQVDSPFQAKAKNQGRHSSILQAYKDKTVQQTSTDEEELLQKKDVLQRVPESEAPKLENAYREAMVSGSMNEETYYNSLKGSKYEFEDDASDEPDDPPVQGKWISPIQFARSPNTISGPKSYGTVKNILYKTDDQGNIDFANPKQYALSNPYTGLNPVKPSSETDITSAVTAHGKTNRYQHFKQANANLPSFGGSNGSSPSGLTWHHLTAKYKMHLVNREVHSKHGHNGGVHIW